MLNWHSTIWMFLDKPVKDAEQEMGHEMNSPLHWWHEGQSAVVSIIKTFNIVIFSDFLGNAPDRGFEWFISTAFTSSFRYRQTRHGVAQVSSRVQQRDSKKY